jgi:hypothetical protein
MSNVRKRPDTGVKLRAEVWYMHICLRIAYPNVGFEVLTAVVIKSSSIWDITSCSPLEVNRPFYFLPASCWLLAWLTLRLWRWRRHVPLKRRLTFSGLHGVICKKMSEVHKPCTSHSVRRCVQLSLHACKWCNGTARHVADKGLAAAVAKGKGNGLWVRETDDLPATVWWGVQVRQCSLHTCTVQCTRAGILCSSESKCCLDYIIDDFNVDMPSCSLNDFSSTHLRYARNAKEDVIEPFEEFDRMQTCSEFYTVATKFILENESVSRKDNLLSRMGNNV